MAYTPELSYQSSCTLRRIAWALDMPMTQTIERIFEKLPSIMDKTEICACCRDRTRCEGCAFSE